MTEIWRPIPGFRTWYEVSESGRVRRIKSTHRHPAGKILKPQRAWDRTYKSYALRKGNGYKNLKASRIVASAFIGRCPRGYQVNHIDGNKLNDHYTNLEYVTQTENMRHAMRLGLLSRGEEHPPSKLKEADIAEIRRLCKKGVKQRDIAKRFGISQSNVSFISRGITWALIRGEKDSQTGHPTDPLVVDQTTGEVFPTQA